MLRGGIRFGLRRLLVGLTLSMPTVLGITGCGGTTTANQLVTTVSAATGGSVGLGDVPSYVVRVVNHGSGTVNGVTVHVDLPAEFRYKATTSLGGPGAARTQPVDAVVNSRNPEWGLWSLPATAVLNNGTVKPGELDITFTVDVQGLPGNYQMGARASSDTTEGDINATPLPVVVEAVPHLSVALAADPGNIRANAKVTYRVTVTNDGTGAASGVAVLVSLPGAFTYTDTAGVSGNSARSDPTNPIKNSSLVDFGGFTIPAHSDAGPGVLVISFHALCLTGTPPGQYPASAQATDSTGRVVIIRDTVPITVAP